MRKSNDSPQNKQHEITRQREHLRGLGCTEEQIERNVAPMTKNSGEPKKGRSCAQPKAAGAVSVDSVRDASAKRIGELTKQSAENFIALGLEFKRVRDTFPVGGQNDDVGAPTSPSPDHTKRPGWHEWIRANTVWSHQQVNSFIRVAEEFGTLKLPANVSHSVLEFLARNHVPEKARKEVLARIADGEKIGRPQAEEIVREKLAKPKDSNDDAGANGGEEAEAETADTNESDDTDADGGDQAEAETALKNEIDDTDAACDDSGEGAEAENVDRAVDARRLVIASIEMEGSRLQTITKAQSSLIARKQEEIEQIVSGANGLLSYRRRAETLAKIESAAEANNKASSAQLSELTP